MATLARLLAAIPLVFLGCAAPATPKADGATSQSQSVSPDRCSGDPEACVEEANRLHLGKVEGVDYVAQQPHPDHVRALALYQDACRSGSGRGCNMAGAMLQHGSGVEANAEASLGFYRQGCELGNATACHNTGFVALI